MYDYYDILNVSRDSSAEEIKASYRKLIRQWHPDKNAMKHSESPQCNTTIHRAMDSIDLPQEMQRDSAFNKIHLAYAVLSDPEQRNIYDKYGSEGISLKKFLHHQMANERDALQEIPESIEDSVVHHSTELRKATNDVEIERGINVILQQRRWDKFRESPVQVISHITLSGVTHFFDDQIASFMRRRLFQIRKSAISNSIEIHLSKHSRIGYTYSSSIARGKFGMSTSSAYASSELTDTLEGAANIDWGEYMSFRYAWLSLKKKFSDYLWVSGIFGIDGYLSPMMRCLVHKSWGDNHAVEITAFPEFVLNYGYNRVLEHDLKLNIQAAVSQDDVGTMVRVKALSNTGAVVGTRCRFSMIGGTYIEGYIRQTFFTEIFAKVKLECRLRYNHNAIFFILKLVLNNTRLDLPIELYRGRTERCLFLGTAAACGVMLLPALSEIVINYFSRKDNFLSQNPYRQSLRSSFYYRFPAFSYLHSLNDQGKRHEKYVSSENVKDTYLSNSSSQWSEDAMEVIVTKDMALARQEGLSLFNVAKASYLREVDSDGLCIMFALYGHPEALNIIDGFVTVDLFDVTLESLDDTSTKPLGTGNRFSYGDVTVTSLLRQNNQLHLQRLFDRYILDVTNVLMSRVTNSCLSLSVSSKGQLIGFADPCANIFNVEPELFICYRYKSRVYTVRFGDADPVVLPQAT
ncbi:DnaJ domain containing protein [Babesia bovis T2Bo]|uniref:DnaJ domain containing protein n=1 Tax=Babesia bovis TaxID=5865 RepID=A7AMM6_BABBO|nr:DnaJ domain containing protein [Babesia bovis T2Bo]EDO07810.1 DnaJ domain containing protein [Babesia bovis T2Bo]|eukprot:XP_001611378.1 DnaJ domain containing protein [Babesia bovis T2Bo]